MWECSVGCMAMRGVCPFDDLDVVGLDAVNVAADVHWSTALSPTTHVAYLYLSALVLQRRLAQS
jgi:hypothetical protein